MLFVTGSVHVGTLQQQEVKTCPYRHCEERSNLANSQVITLRQIASFLAMTVLDFLYDVKIGLRVAPTLVFTSHNGTPCVNVYQICAVADFI